MRAAAEKAIQLDPLLAEAHEALGMAYSRDAQWDQSERSFRRAIELDPSRSMSHDHFAFFLLWPLGRIEEAKTALEELKLLDPNLTFVEGNLRRLYKDRAAVDHILNGLRAAGFD